MSTTVTYIRIYLARIIVIVGCLSILAGYFLTSPETAGLSSELQLWSSAISGFTLFIGLITIFARYIRSVMNREQNWPFHLYCLIVIILWVPFGFLQGIYSDIYQTLYLSTKITLHITIIGMMGWFVVSAMYRTFRVRSFRTAVLAILAIAMIFFNAPYITTPYPVIGDVSYWLLNNPQMSASRAMVICGGIGGVILGIRILLGLERGALRMTGGE
jgi:hypothetical protein